MTRPKKDIPPAKECQITVRMSKELFDTLTHDAAAAQLPRTAYIRQLISGKNPEMKVELVFNDPKILKIFSNLSNITGNLNQIAHHLNSNKGWSKELRERVLSNLSDIQDMRKELKKHLGGFRGDC